MSGGDKDDAKEAVEDKKRDSDNGFGFYTLNEVVVGERRPTEISEEEYTTAAQVLRYCAKALGNKMQGKTYDLLYISSSSGKQRVAQDKVSPNKQPVARARD